MITAILCCAGKGERTGFSENKILHELNGLPVLSYSLSAFAEAGADEILVSCRQEDERAIQALLSPFPNARTVRGGDTRADSVYSALREAKGEIVLVHDGARPFVSVKIIKDCIACVKKYGSGVCALPATDTTVLADHGEICSVPKRSQVFAVQTPQGFFTEKLLKAYEEYRKAGGDFTDDSGIYAQFAAPPHLFEGERSNKKLTYAEDFQPAERVGFGVDTHAFVVADSASSAFLQKAQPRSDRSSSSQNFTAENFGSSAPNSLSSAFPSGGRCSAGTDEGTFITLGGVKIPSEKILKAHSDGDVLVHALMDALLSGAGLRDIGTYFPDTDEAYRGADSMQLLTIVLKHVNNAGFAPQNVSISVLAEAPRLSPYIARMKENVGEALGLPPSAVGIAAGTNEKLGYVGEGKGITVFATVLLKAHYNKE